ncbi:hypothetical protein G6F49_012843 [Rhizopus delemar]|nr:hypothetical protein G6F49_012843 [Rhizopus delemar]
MLLLLPQSLTSLPSRLMKNSMMLTLRNLPKLKRLSLKKKAAFPESKAADQKALDKEILAVAAKNAYFVSYLKSTFSLRKGQFPHDMKF